MKVRSGFRGLRCGFMGVWLQVWLQGIEVRQGGEVLEVWLDKGGVRESAWPKLSPEGMTVSTVSVRRLPGATELCREIGILLPENQRKHCTLHIKKNVLPYALC